MPGDEEYPHPEPSKDKQQAEVSGPKEPVTDNSLLIGAVDGLLSNPTRKSAEVTHLYDESENDGLQNALKGSVGVIVENTEGNEGIDDIGEAGEGLKEMRRISFIKDVEFFNKRNPLSAETPDRIVIIYDDGSAKDIQYVEDPGQGAFNRKRKISPLGPGESEVLADYIATKPDYSYAGSQ